MTQPPHYPEWLEEWWLQRVVEHVPHVTSARDLDALSAEVQQLSDLFIREGNQAFETYYHDPRVLLAYGLFYFPQTFVRVQWPLQELLQRRGWKLPQDRPVRILDLGAGLGSASLGALYTLQPFTSSSFHIAAVDHASQSLQWYRKLARDLSTHWPQATWETRTETLLKYGTPPATERRRGRSKQAKRSRVPVTSPPEASLPEEEPWDLIVSSFALTEVFREQPAEQMWEWLQGLLARLSPEGILLLMEPASQDSCERLEAIRDAVAEKPPFGIWGPCLHYDLCPLRESGKAWCHEVRPWTVPHSLHGLNRRMHRAIQNLKFGYLALGHSHPPHSGESSPRQFRMVAPMTKQKGRWLTTGCAAHGELVKLEIFTRDLSSSNARILETFQRGDIVEASELLERSKPQQYRLAPGATLTGLHPQQKCVALNTKD